MAKRKRLPVSHWMAPNVTAWESDYLPPVIDELKSDLTAWQTADLRTTENLWQLLGGIYSHSAKIEYDKNALMALIAMVNQIDGVRESNRWHAHTKAPQELLIVLLLGFGEDKKSTRSQWRSALMAAERSSVRKTKQDFIDWITKVGGIEAARKSVARPRPTMSTKQLADEVDKLVLGEDRIVQIPFKLSDEPMPEKFGLVLVREADSQNTAFQIATITNEHMVRSALKALLIQHDAGEKEELAGIQRMQRKRLAKVNALYRKLGGLAGTKMEPDEFLQEWETENLVTPEEKATRITEAP